MPKAKTKATIGVFSLTNNPSANSGVGVLDTYKLEEALAINTVQKEGINGKGELKSIDALGGFETLKSLGDIGDSIAGKGHFATTVKANLPDPLDNKAIYQFIFDMRGVRTAPLAVFHTNYDEDFKAKSTSILATDATVIVPPVAIDNIYTIVKFAGMATKTLEFNAGLTQKLQEKMPSGKPQSQDDHLFYAREVLKHLIASDENSNKIKDIRDTLEADERIVGALISPAKFKKQEHIDSLVAQVGGTALSGVVITSLNDVKGFDAVINGKASLADQERYAELVADMAKREISTNVRIKEVTFTTIGVDSTGNLGVYRNTALGGEISNSALYSDKEFGLGLLTTQKPIRDAYKVLVPAKDAKFPAKTEMKQAEAHLKSVVSEEVGKMALSEYERKIVDVELAKIVAMDLTGAILTKDKKISFSAGTLNVERLKTLGLRATTANLIAEKGLVARAEDYLVMDKDKLKGINYGAEMPTREETYKDFVMEGGKTSPVKNYLLLGKMPHLTFKDEIVNHTVPVGLVAEIFTQEAGENNPKQVKINIGQDTQNWAKREALGVALGEILNLEPSEDMEQESVNKFNYVVRRQAGALLSAMLPKEGEEATKVQKEISQKFGVLLSELNKDVLSGTLTNDEIKGGDDASLESIMGGVKKAQDKILSFRVNQDPNIQHLGMYAENSSAVIEKNRANQHLSFSLFSYKKEIEEVLLEENDEAMVTKAEELSQKYTEDDKSALAELKIITGALRISSEIKGLEEVMKYQFENNIPLYPTAKIGIGESLAYTLASTIKKAQDLALTEYGFINGKRVPVLTANLGLSAKTADIIRAEYKDDTVSLSINGVNKTSFRPEVEILGDIYDHYNEIKPKRNATRAIPTAPRGVEQEEAKVEFGEINFGSINEAKQEIAPEKNRENEISIPTEKPPVELVDATIEETTEVTEEEFDITITEADPADIAEQELAEQELAEQEVEEEIAQISLQDLPLEVEDDLPITLSEEVEKSLDQRTSKRKATTPKKK